MIRARRVGAAQTIPHRGDVGANVEQHARLVHAAAEERAEVLVFPELSLTGYELDLVGDLAFSDSDPRLDPVVELATSHRMTLIVGAPVRIGPLIHIGAYIVGADGKVVLYTKRHLGAGEETAVHPGDHSPLVDLGGNMASVAVCADANRPSHPEEAADRGAKTYLVSTFVAPSELQEKTQNLRAYAVRHRMAVVFANYGGPSGGLESGGGSAIWSGEGELLGQLQGIGTGLVVGVESDDGWSGKALMLSGL